ncbi:T-cell receptor beta variable [Clarias magur]|nr:T-cell receptor beta variable [Clarias magur]
MIRVLVVFHSLYWIQGAAGVNDVTQSNAFLVEMGKSATIDCSHTKGPDYNQMYWFRQYHGESMELIVYTTSYGTKDFGKFKQSSGVCSVIQNPPHLIKPQDEFAEIKCAHTVKSYDRILWYKHSQDSGFTFMGYIYTTISKPEAEFDPKIKLSGDGKNNGSLTINNLTSLLSVKKFPKLLAICSGSMGNLQRLSVLTRFQTTIAFYGTN